ncbi:sensor histidine kinase [Nitrincola tapanii]|uniref:histidine kinase n=1 Tax=Nitrincola tapanii TaxID=1708751 RepID=A0A5A9W2V4_9GAMM|nr:ATP-binding protein [Nitrincola tapanii]KAA0874435.1 hypothetical protein E1H14_09190 [Nitrincola tapanii]
MTQPSLEQANSRFFSDLLLWMRKLHPLAGTSLDTPTRVASQKARPHSSPLFSLEIARCEHWQVELAACLAPWWHHLSLPDTSQAWLGLPSSPCAQVGSSLLPLLTAAPEAKLPLPASWLEGLQSVPAEQQRVEACFETSTNTGKALWVQAQALDLPQGRHWWLLITPQPLSQSTQLALHNFLDNLETGLHLCQLQELRLQAARDEERRCHAAELHDSLAQMLAYLRLRTSRLQNQRPTCPVAEQALVDDIAQHTRHAYRLTRELISQTRIGLECPSLHAALMELVAEFENQSALVFELDDRALTQHPDARITRHLLMIAREALYNTLRHAQASHVRIQLLPLAPQGLHLSIEDNGQGLHAREPRADSFGLQIMRERAEKIGAQLHLGAGQSGGTRLDLYLNRLDL